MEWAKLKDEGNTLLNKGDSKGAVLKYTEALALCQDDVTNQQILYSNRSAAALKSGDLEGALADAEKCVSLNTSWAKGYSRKAAVLKEMKRYDEAIAVAEEGLKFESTNVALKTIQKACETSMVCDKLRGMWHGKVAEEVGGYMQSFDFWSDNDVRVSVLGTTVEAKYDLNVFGTPYPHLDMSVPNSPGSAFVRHIYRFENDDELHLCSPYLKPPEERPTKFAGAGMVVMSRGPFVLSEAEQEERKMLMSKPLAQRVDMFLERCTQAVPPFDVRPREGENEIAVGEKLTANVKFQTFYQGLIEKLGPDAEQHVKELVVGVRSLQNETDETGELVRKFQDKMRSAGLISDGEESAPPSSSSETNAVVGVPPDEAMLNKEAISRFVSGADEPLAEIEPLPTTAMESPVKPKARKSAAAKAASSEGTDWTPIILAVTVTTAVVAVGLAFWLGEKSKRD
jgi:hypothetical protein